jgi:nucleoside-diphosphate-sugar epimerase
MSPRTCLITGSNGVIGQKLARWLMGGTVDVAGKATQWHVKLLDDYDGFCQGKRNDPTTSEVWEGFPDKLTGTFEHVQGELSQYSDEWVSSFEGVDAVIHFQANNPYPECNWYESQASMAMTGNTLAAAHANGVSRYVFASSNHVMGNYWREGPILTDFAPAITPSTPPNTGTRFEVPAMKCDATPYATAKLAGEVMCKSAAAANHSSGFSAVAVRIGWCQPGANTPDMMSAAGTPTVTDGNKGAGGPKYSERALGYDCDKALLAWFQNMWLSNRDMGQIFQRSLEFEFTAAQNSELQGYICVNGNSANTGKRWSECNFDLLGYRPVDDVSKQPGYKNPYGTE